MDRLRNLLQQTISSCTTRIDGALVIIGAILLALQGFVVTGLATNLPFSDGWTVLRSNCLQDAVQWPWIWELHNEHRLVWTKLLHWANLRFLRYSLIAQATINYVIFIGLVWALLHYLKKEYKIPVGLMVVSLSSALIWEIHFWGFQTHFILYPLCLVLAVRLLAHNGARSWWGVVCAAAGVYTMANGVLAAGCCVAFCLARASLNCAKAQRFVIQGALIAASIFPWSRGFQKNPGHPDFAGPWTKPFWKHLGLTFTQGFGLQNQHLAWLGVILFVLLIYLWVHRALALLQQPEEQKVSWLALATYTAAMLLSVGVTSMARAGLGGPTPRYCLPVVLLVPVYWTLLSRDWLRRAWQYGLVGTLLVLPLLPHFKYVSIYTQANHIIDQHRGCIAAYYHGTGDGHCPGSYPADGLPEILDLAREMRLPFTQDMLPEYEAFARSESAILEAQYCYLDGLDGGVAPPRNAPPQQVRHSRAHLISLMGWGWDPSRQYPQRDVAIEFEASDGAGFALQADRFVRKDLHFCSGASRRPWGVSVEKAVPAQMRTGPYKVWLRQGRGRNSTRCLWLSNLELTD